MQLSQLTKNYQIDRRINSLKKIINDLPKLLNEKIKQKEIYFFDKDYISAFSSQITDTYLKKLSDNFSNYTVAGYRMLSVTACDKVCWR